MTNKVNKMISKIKRFLLPIILISAIAALPSFCECAIEGGVCGDNSTWDPCCNPDRYHCEIENEDAPEGERFGICVANEEDIEE